MIQILREDDHDGVEGLLCCCFCPPPVLMSWLVLHTDITPTQPTSSPSIHPVVTQDHRGWWLVVIQVLQGDDHDGVEVWRKVTGC